MVLQSQVQPVSACGILYFEKRVVQLQAVLLPNGGYINPVRRRKGSITFSIDGDSRFKTTAYSESAMAPIQYSP